MENENLNALINNIASKLDRSTPSLTHVNAYRLGRSQTKDRPIMVHLDNRNTRDSFTKSKIEITPNDIGLKTPSTDQRSIYINEALTRHDKEFYKANIRRRELNYKYIRTAGGVVHCKKEEGSPKV